MTVSSEQSFIEYIGDGTTKTFTIPFYFLLGSDISITITDTAGSETVLVYGVNFSVVGDGSPSGGAATINTAPASGYIVSILRDPPVTQQTAYQENGKFPAKSHEKALDKLTMLIQAAIHRLNVFGAKAVKVPESGNWVAPKISDRNNRLFAWDNEGKAIAVLPPSSSASDVLIQLANSSDGKGADLVTFLQAGLNAVPRSVKSKLREYVDLEDYGTIDRSGETLAIATANTAVINKALAAAASLGKALRLSSGVILALPFSIPATLPGLIGRGKFSTTIKFYRQSYSVGALLINAQNNTASPEFCDFTIDCDDAVFKTSVVTVFPYTNTDNIMINRVRVVGRGDNCVITQNSKNCRIYDLTVNATGVTGATFNTCFQGQNCKNSLVVSMKTTGFPVYAGTFGIGSSGCKFIGCHSEGTGGAFAWSIAASSYCGIFETYSENSSHEAFQLTDTTSCIIALCNCTWDSGYGQDAGISIHGKTLPTRFNIVIANTINNSYAAGLMAADNALYNNLNFNTLKDCGVRGTAAGQIGSFICAMSQYTALNSQSCVSNTFSHNTCLSETGTTTYGYGEFVNGTGSVIADTILQFNKFYGAFTIRYLAASAAKRIWDIDALSFTPVVGATGGGSITSSTINSASFRRNGDYIDMSMDITINTTSGTINGLLLTWPGAAPLPSTYQGMFTGREQGSAKMLSGAPSGSGVELKFYDGTNPATAGARVIVQGRFK